MYKKLSCDEERMIREGTDPLRPAPKKSVIVRNILLFAVIFLAFTLMTYLILASVTAGI